MSNLRRKYYLGSKRHDNKKNSKGDLLAYLIVIELVLGGSGRLVTIGSFLTIRYILFFIAIGYFCVKVVTRSCKSEVNMFYGNIFLFFAIYTIAVFNGVLRGYELRNIVQSSQGYLYLLMMFPFTYFINDVNKSKKIMRVFTNSAILLSIVSIVIFLVFWRDSSQFALLSGTLTKFNYGYLAMRGGLPAVFLKTSPYMAVTLIYELFQYTNNVEQRDSINLIKMLLLAIGCLTTMSMGIWISVAIGTLCVFLFTKRGQKIIIVIAIVFITIVLFAIFSKYIILVIHNRFSADDSSYIIKLNQLYTLLATWKSNFLFGSGFGVEINFTTELGSRTMVNFELFWIQLLVNMGAIGFVIYTGIIIKSIKEGFKVSKVESKIDAVHIKGMVIGLIVLCIISSVNPFLNNPIGIGYLIIVICTINTYQQQYVKEKYSKKNCNISRN